MGNASDEEQPAVVEQVDAPDIATSSQMTFRVAVKKGSLSTASSRGSLYLEWSIITDPTDIDGPENDNEIETGSSTIGGEENEKSESSDEEGDEENTPDTINNIEESGRVLDCVETPQPLALQKNSPSLTCRGYLPSIFDISWNSLRSSNPISVKLLRSVKAYTTESSY